MLPNRQSDELRERLADFLSARSVIVGLGNIARGDDGFGPAVARALHGRVAIPLIDAGPAPENFTGRIADYAPDTVLFMDAADLGQPAGRLVLADATELNDIAANTHVGNLSLLAGYLQSAIAAHVLFLLAQPMRVDRLPPDEPFLPGDFDHEEAEPGIMNLSMPMRQAVEQAAALICNVLNGRSACRV